MAIPKEVLDALLKDYKGPDDLVGPEGLLKELTKALVERAMQAEMTQQLGYDPKSRGAKTGSNRRNGTTKKTVRSDQGPITLEVPRDREAVFEPKIIPKHQREFKGFDDKILSMYARGLSTREISEHLKEIYGVDVSPDLISRTTDSVKELLAEWRNRPLEAFYPILFLDAIMIKVRDGGQVVSKSVYLALAIRLDGQKELLGLWIDAAEGAKFWLRVLNELQNRGLRDVLIAAVDGLSGFPDAIRTVFPKTEVQLCIVHVVRNSLRYVPYKDKKAVAADLKAIYLAATEVAASAALDSFAEKWDTKYPTIAANWRRRWEEVIPFLQFPAELRKVIYTTNAIESVNYTIRKVTRNRQSFPTEEAAQKLVYMALQNISKKWTMPLRNWGAALNQFAIIYGTRVPI
jgi:putative transposase